MLKLFHELWYELSHWVCVERIACRVSFPVLAKDAGFDLPVFILPLHANAIPGFSWFLQ